MDTTEYATFRYNTAKVENDLKEVFSIHETGLSYAGSNSFSCNCRGLKYICLHVSGLSYN